MVADILNPLLTMSESERGSLIAALKTVMSNQAEIKRIENLVRNKITELSLKLDLLLSFYFKLMVKTIAFTSFLVK